MRKIVIGASKNNKIGSKLIQWWINAEFSHVYARWNLNDQDREIVYHASHGMVHFKAFENFKAENEIVLEFEIELTDEQFKKFSQKCIDLAGQPYSFKELAQIFINDITLGKVTFKDQPGYICSELMAELLEGVGFSLTKPKHMIDPTDIVMSLILLDFFQPNKVRLITPVIT